MSEIYGYKTTEISSLLQFISANDRLSLAGRFRAYAEKRKRAPGSIRNLYYAICKKAQIDKEFCQKYFNGNPPRIEKIEKFSSLEEKELVKKILKSKEDGKSVRGIVLELANGDGKQALRLQNKYRNVIKRNPKLVNDIILELKGEGIIVTTDAKKQVNEFQYLRLKREIDGLMDRLNRVANSENIILRQKICRLETENFRLRKKALENTRAKDYFMPLLERVKQKH